jgi:uncharacterized protein DUF955
MEPLDRMAVEEAGPNPQRMAAAIHRQLGPINGPIPVADIAAALDIVEIRVEPLRSLEGALIAPGDRHSGAILLNSASSTQRRSFTLAHELGHFLNLWHRPIDSLGRFACTRSDLATSWRKASGAASRHLVQEAEANRFAIELLAPARLVQRYVRALPDLADALRLAGDLALSKEAAARRYVELHDQPTALIFAANGVVRYVERNPDFPFVVCRSGEPLPALFPPPDRAGLSAHEEADPRDWLARPSGQRLVVQTLHQERGYAVTLLAIDTEGDAEADEA